MSFPIEAPIEYRKRLERVKQAPRLWSDGVKFLRDHSDILVDLKGYTRNNRLSICALRPAPIQVSYLGFPGSTGADFMDYIITDEIVTPEAEAAFYSEKFVVKISPM